MISTWYAAKYCSEPIENIENYEQAVNDKEHLWHCHHRAEVLPCGRYSQEVLKKMGMYWNRPASELIFLTANEHMSLHRQGNNPWKGRHHTQKSKALMSESQKGRKVTQETRERMSKSNPQKKKVKMTSIDGETVKVFDSFHHAERWLRDNGFPKAGVGTIWRCCSGKRNRAYNAKWSYAEEDES